MDNSYSERYSVVFLLNANPASQIVLLKRASWKKFAPNLYTGIGGHIERGEEHMVGAKRELQEEVGIEADLTEFARCIIIESNKILHYYWSIYEKKNLPVCTEGSLEWVSTHQILQKEIIPTTWFVVREWNSRSFDTSKPFTVFLHEVPSDGILARSVERVENRLQ